MAILGFIFGLAILLPERILHRETAASTRKGAKLFTLYTALVMVLLCTLPMTLAPSWNGTVKSHRDQYERMAESLLAGRLNLEYNDIDPRLAEMENPYDTAARKEAGVKVHWDHAYYNGQYYMYFGIVPVLLLFLPFRVITGQALNTMYATMIFTACGIIGIFMLFKLLARRFFPKMTQGTCLALSMAVSVISFWYASDFAALYCTATSSAVCMMIWSFYFFFRAVYTEPEEKRQIRFAALGSLFGALAFGCRPSTALANLLVIPLLISYLKQKKAAGSTVKQEVGDGAEKAIGDGAEKLAETPAEKAPETSAEKTAETPAKKPSGKITGQLVGKLVLAALPYVIVAALLMLYNYARFDNPFEFGQSYQLTSADQHEYGSLLSRLSLTKILTGIDSNFFTLGKRTATFPWISSYGGAIWNFPLLLAGLALLLPKNLRAAKKEKALGTMAALVALPLIITVLDVLWAPSLLERYRMDIYYLMGIATFCAIGFIGEGIEKEKDQTILRTVVTVLALVAMLKALLLWLVPYDANYTKNVTGALQQAAKALFFVN